MDQGTLLAIKTARSDSTRGFNTANPIQ
jgi:hypothetical protein